MLGRIHGVPDKETQRWVRIWRRLRGHWGPLEDGSFAWWLNAYVAQEEKKQAEVFSRRGAA